MKASDRKRHSEIIFGKQKVSTMVIYNDFSHEPWASLSHKKVDYWLYNRSEECCKNEAGEWGVKCGASHHLCPQRACHLVRQKEKKNVDNFGNNAFSNFNKILGDNSSTTIISTTLYVEYIQHIYLCPQWHEYLIFLSYIDKQL